MRSSAGARVRAEVATLVPPALVSLAVLEYAARSQAGHLPLLRAGLALALTQLVPGALVWRAMRPRSGWLVEDLALGAALGAALAVPGQVLAVVLGREGCAWLLGWAVAGVLLAVPGTRRRIAGATWSSLPWWWGTAVAGACAVMLSHATGIFAQVLPGHARWTTQYVDVPYHQALAAELAQRWPPHSPQVAAERLDYHWFSHAWLAQVHVTSGTDLDVVLVRFAPIAITAVATVVMACVAMRLVDRDAAGPVAALGLSGLGALAVTTPWNFFLPTSPYSPSAAFAVLVGLPLVVLLVLRWRGQVDARAWPLVAFLALAVGGAKGSWLPVAVVGTALALLVAVLARHPRRRRVGLDLGLLAGALLFVLVVLFRGNDGAMRLVPFTSLVASKWQVVMSPEGIADLGVGGRVALTVLLLALIVLPHALAFGVLRDRVAALDPGWWLLVGAAAAGLGALLVLSHPSASQLYFWRAAAPLAVLAVVWGLFTLVRTPREWWLAGAAAVVGLFLLGPAHGLVQALLPGGERGLGTVSGRVAVVVGVLLVLGALAARRAGRAAGVAVLLAGLAGAGVAGNAEVLTESPFTRRPLPAGPHVGGSVNDGQVAAMRHVAAHAAPHDLVMTNRHCRNLAATRCNNRRFWVAAYGEHRVLVEGWGYTRTSNYGGEGEPGYVSAFGDFWDPGLLALNDGFYTDPTPQAASRLWDLGVRWVYAERSSGFSSALGEVADLVHRNRDASVFRLRGPGTVAP